MRDDPELAEIRARLAREIAARAAAPSPAPAGPLVATEENLPRLLAEHRVLLLDCWAAWCGPCQMMEPAVKALAEELSGEAAVAKLNVDEHPRVAQALGAESIPTFVVFKDGRPVDRVVGAVHKGQLAAAVRRHAGPRGRGAVGPRR